MFNFKSIVNAVVNSDSIATKVIGYTALAAVGIGADIISAGAKKAEEAKVAETPAPATEEVRDEDILTEVIHDEDTVEEVFHDDDVVVEVVHDEVYDDSADRQEEDELFDAAIKSTSNSFIAACENAVAAKKSGYDNIVTAMEEIAKLHLNYLQLNLGKEEECLMVHNAREALAAFRTFGPTRIEWM